MPVEFAVLVLAIELQRFAQIWTKDAGDENRERRQARDREAQERRTRDAERREKRQLQPTHDDGAHEVAFEAPDLVEQFEVLLIEIQRAQSRLLRRRRIHVE